MAHHIKFPSIRQLRSVKKSVGKNGDPNKVYDFFGTVKLHGTNAAICYDGENFWCQSRNKIITPVKDNAGFAAYVEKRKDIFKDILVKLFYIFTPQVEHSTIVLFGEWCGGNIQKNVAIAGLEKMFVIFDIYLEEKSGGGVKSGGGAQSGEKTNVKSEDDESFYRLESQPSILRTTDVAKDGRNVWRELFSNPEQSFYNIYDFPTYEISIDFKQGNEFLDKEVTEKLLEYTDDVEKECPVGKHFGRVVGKDNTTGEGIVWRTRNNRLGDRFNYIFKVKGDEHAVTKGRDLSRIEKMKSIEEFVERTATQNRFRQGIDFLKEKNGIEENEIDVTNTRDFIKWVTEDIIKEESDTMEKVETGPLKRKDVAKYISARACNWFKRYLVT